jgi:hypothetical protein
MFHFIANMLIFYKINLPRQHCIYTIKWLFVFAKIRVIRDNEACFPIFFFSVKPTPYGSCLIDGLKPRVFE